MAFSVSPHCCCFSSNASSRMSLILSPNRMLSSSAWSAFTASLESISWGSCSFGSWSIESCEWNAEHGPDGGSEWTPLSWEPLFSLLVVLLSGWCCCVGTGGLLLLESCERSRERAGVRFGFVTRFWRGDFLGGGGHLHGGFHKYTIITVNYNIKRMRRVMARILRRTNLARMRMNRDVIHVLSKGGRVTNLLKCFLILMWCWVGGWWGVGLWTDDHVDERTGISSQGGGFRLNSLRWKTNALVVHKTERATKHFDSRNYLLFTARDKRLFGLVPWDGSYLELCVY